jgi:hypothetical protein
MGPDCFTGIMGAGGCKAALGAEEGAQGQLVEPDESQQDSREPGFGHAQQYLGPARDHFCPVVPFCNLSSLCFCTSWSKDLFNCRTRVWLSMSFRPTLATKTISRQSGLSFRLRKTSLHRRFTRLRLTAFPTFFFETIRPSLEAPVRFGRPRIRKFLEEIR